LSVLRALQAELPQERFIYVADHGHAPYGERDDVHVLRRSHAIADFLVARHAIKALVVACNTATAAAIHTLRAQYPLLPIIGIEPALKPAAAVSRTGVVGVMATRATLNSDKFARLLESLRGTARFVLQPCDGLADAIERSDGARTRALCSAYTQAMGGFGDGSGAIDTLVLGCTHYPFVAAQLQALVGDKTALLEGGEPVARQAKRLLDKAGLTQTGDPSPGQAALPAFYSTGNPTVLDSALERWLGLNARTLALDLP
jgi:glutamate racemase